MRRGPIILSTFVATLVVLAGAGAAILYTGAFPVSAQAAHTPAVRWLLHTAKDRGISAGARQVPPAPELTDAMARAAAGPFAQTCAHCHGAPGVARADFAGHMRPEPPELSHAAEHMGPRELYWVVTHGLRMTGMPAFGPLLGDDEVWNLVALVNRLPTLSPRDFGAWVEEAARGGAATAPAQAQAPTQTLGDGATGDTGTAD